MGEAVASVLGQEQVDASLDVRDGGSTDGSVQILQSFDAPDAAYRWRSGPDGGQADAINRGLRDADGDICAFLNSDDMYLPGALQRVADHFASHPEVLVVYGNASVIDEAGRTLGPYPVEPWDAFRLQVTCFLCQPAVFWRRSVQERYGLLDATLHYALDFEFWLRLSREVPFFHLAGPPLAASRQHPETKTERAKVEVHRECLEVVLRHGGQPGAVVKWLRALADCQLAARPRLPKFWRARAALHAWLLWQGARRHGVPIGPELRHEFRRALGGKSRWQAFHPAGGPSRITAPTAG